MDTINSLLAILTGLLLRLAIPVAVTALLIYFLRKLDARWQEEGETIPLKVEKPKCWEIRGCSPEDVKNCRGAASSLPCWQEFRQPNGYLNEACLTCNVFKSAPVPA